MCGLMAIVNHPEAANLTYLGLYAQQHRGQEGVGIVCRDDDRSFSLKKGKALVSDVFRDYDFSQLPGKTAIGHVRYTTAGGSSLDNVQPIFAEISKGRVAIAHNGNLINAEKLRQDLIQDGAIFGTSSDTEVILHLIARTSADIPIEEAVISALEQVRGAYSLLILFADKLMIVRDPAGLRPLALGKMGNTYVAASETCAFDLLGAEYERDVRPGELIVISGDGEVKSYFPFQKEKSASCIFEYVYFARPDSRVFEKNVYAVRRQMGVELARESHIEADIVIPVPDSGVTAALGYAEQARIPLELGLIRNHYVGRTFIEPMQSIRDFGVKIKHNANPEVLENKRVIVVDDSIVRGTTSRKLVSMLRDAGAKEVHMRISSPPTIDPCYYGIDTPQKDQLIASQKSIPEIADYMKVDSLAYLSLDGLYKAVGEETSKMCDACFTGNYPLGTPQKLVQIQQEKLL